ncbi:MAG: metallopeptidase family protein [Acidobacteriota bacterium]
MVRMGREDFEALVGEALDGLPEELGELVENLVVVVEDEPSDELLRELDMDPEEDSLFGLYQGVELPERGLGSYGGALPDRVVIFRLPLLEHCSSRRELLREIRDTVVHEIGHYFGLDEDQLP